MRNLTILVLIPLNESVSLIVLSSTKTISIAVVN